LNQCIIIDNSPHSYIFQPDHAFPITTWFDDQTDRELTELMPFLELIAEVRFFMQRRKS
jgi:RNA polymerase II subunit A small phosphatase-like protein